MDSLTSELHRLLSKSRLKREVISIIASLYNKIFPDSKHVNQDFVVSFEDLIDQVLLNLSRLVTKKLDKYKVGQLVIVLLRDHILNGNSAEKQQSVESQIDNFEYDICQSFIVKLFGLLSNDTLRRVIYTIIHKTKSQLNHDLYQDGQQYPPYRPFARATAGLSLEDIIESSTSNFSDEQHIGTTSALYTLIIAMLTKAVVMPIVDSISEPKFLLASIIWVCKKEEADRLKKEKLLSKSAHRDRSSFSKENQTTNRYQNVAKQAPSTSIIVTNTRNIRSLDLEEGYDIASANINFINPICGSLKRPIENIEIFATEEVKSNNSCYILYCIRYDGICYRHPSAGGFSFIPDNPEVPIIDKRQTHSVRRRNNRGIEQTRHTMDNQQQREVPNRKSFRRSMVVKRRFREFVLLQLRLEENPKTRVFMSKMPKPTKLKAATQNIFSLPGINNIKLDQSTIRIRQRFLERFLNALNNSPFISNSYEFKEFFSYNVNPVGMSKSKSTILQVNLNKVLVDGVKSAFTMIRSTLPGDDYQSLRANLHSDPDAWLTELQQSTLKLHIQTRTSQSKMNLERLIDAKLSSLDDSPVRSSTNRGSLPGRYHQDPKQHHQHQGSGTLDWLDGNRGGSLRARSSSSSISSSVLISRSSSSNLNSQNVEIASKSVSNETIYHDASNEFETQCKDDKGLVGERALPNLFDNNSIQICDSFPIGSKLIDIIHYSISKNPACSNSPINFAARLLFGRMIERYATQLLNAAITLDNTAFCLDGIASGIWDENISDPPFDIEHATLDEAVERLTRLIEQNYAGYPFIPKQFLRGLISKQMRFYLSQLESKSRNKFVIYSFFVQILDELELDQHE